MAVFVALLRAVNVGGTGRVAMAELKTACEAAGLRRVATYIASGNIVFDSDRPAAELKPLIAGLLRERFGLADNGPVLRTPEGLAAAIAANPFRDAAAARPKLLMVGFLDRPPPEGAAAALAAYPGPERLHLAGDHLFIEYVDGVARSKLSAAFLARALQVPATARNWNTATTLLEMARALEG